MSNTLYDQDFYAWANEQAALLRAGRFGEIDVENVAEEIESMGRSQKSELVNRLAVLLTHLLKWRYQPGFRSKSWRLTIAEQRFQIERHLRDNPSLKSHLAEPIADGYRLARLKAERETGLESFPDACPFSFDEAMDDGFWPD
ncbi:MAG TPA: DUF29 domain-containing protein [Acetobacteraceae bacterium]|nr:DUF29 domain-containing protein [Acetobacteraceae bacterium]